MRSFITNIIFWYQRRKVAANIREMDQFYKFIEQVQKQHM